MLKKLLTVGAVLLMSQAFANYTLTFNDCPPCTSKPGNKDTWRQYEYTEQHVLVWKSYVAGPCGSC